MIRSSLDARILVRESTYICLVHMVVVSFVGTADEHDEEILSIINGVIANRRFEKMSVLFEPLGDVDRWRETHISSSPRQDGGKRRDGEPCFIIIFCRRVDRDFDRPLVPRGVTRLLSPERIHSAPASPVIFFDLIMYTLGTGPGEVDMVTGFWLMVTGASGLGLEAQLPLGDRRLNSPRTFPPTIQLKIPLPIEPRMPFRVGDTKRTKLTQYSQPLS